MFRAETFEDTGVRPTEAAELYTNASMIESLKSLNKKGDFDPQKFGMASDDLIDMGDQVAQAGDSGGDLAGHAQAIGDLLKGATKEDAAEAFADYIGENGGAMYAAAEAADPADPLGYLEKQLNEALKDTDYTANGDRQAAELSVYSKSGEFVTNVPIGPSNPEMFGIPKQ